MCFYYNIHFKGTLLNPVGCFLDDVLVWCNTPLNCHMVIDIVHPVTVGSHNRLAIIYPRTPYFVVSMDTQVHSPDC
jgi:hypothetical protein